jgi:hypothetical protein
MIQRVAAIARLFMALLRRTALSEASRLRPGYRAYRTKK